MTRPATFTASRTPRVTLRHLAHTARPVAFDEGPFPGKGTRSVTVLAMKLHGLAIKPEHRRADHIRGTDIMTKALTAAAMILLLAPSVALAQHRAGDAALGAVSGAVVLGPIGAVAGAFIGYSAGPAIARSWGIDRSGSTRQRRHASRERVRGARAEAVGSAGARPAAAAPRVEKDTRLATSRGEANNAPPSAPSLAPSATTAPPVQTLE